MIKDNVHCTNCEKDSLIQCGSNRCTKCKKTGMLLWNEPKEVTQ